LNTEHLKKDLTALREIADRDLDIATNYNDANYYLGKIDAIDTLLELLN